MQKVLPTATTQNHTATNTTQILRRVYQNTSYQVEANRTHYLISDIISQFKLLMEYLPGEYQQLDLILTELVKIQTNITDDIIGIYDEFEFLKGELIDSQKPCKCGGECL